MYEFNYCIIILYKARSCTRHLKSPTDAAENGIGRRRKREEPGTGPADKTHPTGTEDTEKFLAKESVPEDVQYEFFFMESFANLTEGSRYNAGHRQQEMIRSCVFKGRNCPDK